MLAKILGAIWIILGLLWLIKPEILKNRLKKKINRRMRRVVYGFLLVFGFLMIGSAFKVPGVLPKIIGIIGMIIAIKAIIMIMSKASEKMFDWWAERPLIYFRIWALVILAIGVMLIIV
ncbi:MAG: hypothetical protein WBD04_05295 [Candidatus Omnitrophota bacterium]